MTQQTELSMLADLFDAIHHPQRLALIRLLAQAQEGMSVSAIHTQLRIAQPTASHHLGKLYDAGWVLRTPQGKRVLYAINPDALETVLNEVKSLSAPKPVTITP